MCLALVVTAVSASAAWFGNAARRKLGADLEISAGTVSNSTSVSIASGDPNGQTLAPAVAVAGAFGNAQAYPGNYFKGATDGDVSGEMFDEDKATALDPSFIAPDGIQTNARSVRFVLSIRYAADDSSGNLKTIRLMLDGVYCARDLTKEGSGQYSGYEVADGMGRNFKNEFNVKMGLVSSGDGSGEPVPQDVVKYDDTYCEDNPFGHILTVEATPDVLYFVQFEIYFNKVDEECEPELLFADLVLHIKLDTGATQAPYEP